MRRARPLDDLVAPHWASRISWSDRKVHVDLSRHAIKKSPEWNANVAIDRAYEERLYGYHGLPVYWEGGGGTAGPSLPHPAGKRSTSL